MAEVRLGSIAEFSPGTMKRVVIDTEPLVVIVTAEGVFHILYDLCTHANAPLSDGWLEDGCVACPWHGWAFDLATGAALVEPESARVRTCQVSIADGRVLVLG